jgi:hypothetical protein
MLANKLAREIRGEFSGLESHLQNTLRSYGLGEDTWNILKTGTPTKTPAGRSYMTPSVAWNVDADAIEQLLRARGTIAKGAEQEAVDRAIGAYRQDLSDKLGMFFQDAADHAVVAPGVREQAILSGNMKPGSVGYEMLQLSQFSTWPVAAMHQKLGREFAEGLGNADKLWGVGLLAGLSVLGGYIRMTARDLTSGDQPRTPRSVGDAMRIGGAALAQGGGLGLLGDWLFGEVVRLGAGNFGIGGQSSAICRGSMKSATGRPPRCYPTSPPMLDRSSPVLPAAISRLPICFTRRPRLIISWRITPMRR